MQAHAVMVASILLGMTQASWAQTSDPGSGTRSPVGTVMPEGSKSGSGTSSSGGSDANGDRGRDKMPESSNTVRSKDDEQDKKLGGPPGKR